MTAHKHYSPEDAAICGCDNWEPATPEDRPWAGPKRPEYEPGTAEQRLGYLVEECAEVLEPLATHTVRVLKAVGKTLRRGLDGTNPELPEEQRETNAKWLLRELADLEAAISRVREKVEAWLTSAQK